MFFLGIKAMISKTSKPVSFAFPYMLMWIVKVRQKEGALAGYLKYHLQEPRYHPKFRDAIKQPTEPPGPIEREGCLSLHSLAGNNNSR